MFFYLTAFTTAELFSIAPDSVRYVMHGSTGSAYFNESLSFAVNKLFAFCLLSVLNYAVDSMRVSSAAWYHWLYIRALDSNTQCY